MKHPFHPLDSDWNDPILGTIAVIGDAGIDFMDIDDLRCPDWWKFCPFLNMN